MKAFAITSLVIFFLVKAVAYSRGFFSKTGYVSDFSDMLNVVLPIMSVFTYIGGFFMIAKDAVVFIVAIVLAWLILVITILTMKYLPTASYRIIADDNYDCFRVAKGVITAAKRIDRDIIYDDNIGVGNSIKITFNSRKFSRKEMSLLIGEQYRLKEATRPLQKISLLSFLIHSVELIFDISFLINISLV